MHQSPHIDPEDRTGSENCFREEDLNLYLDGELSLEKQSDLFSHMSSCEACRSVMDSVMMFRRMSRQEYVALPPAADERFFERLASVKEAAGQFDRYEDREPLWNSRRKVSVKSAVFAVFAVFVIGLSLPRSEHSEIMTTMVQYEEEQVDFDDERPEVLQSYIHVFVPGLTVEADKSEDSETVPLESF